MKHTHTWPATIEIIPEMQAATSALLTPHDLPMKTMMHVELVIEEVVANIVHYAYTECRGESFFLTTELGAGTLTLTFTDHGPPFDPTQVMDPDTTLSAEDRRIGGLGIFMVKKLAHSVSYERQGNANHLRVEFRF